MAWCCMGKKPVKSNGDAVPNGVSVHWLQTGFIREIEDAGLSKDSTIYDIEDLRDKSKLGVVRSKGEHKVCPRDQMLGAAYVDCLEGEDNVGTSDVMLSYGWGNAVVDIVESLSDYCQSENVDPKRTYVWICCLCNNQHRVANDLMNGTQVPFDEFERVFHGRVTSIKKVLSLMSPWTEPIYLRRVWCIFELYTAFEAEECELKIIMPPREKRHLVDAINEGGEEGISTVYTALSNTNIEEAEASVQHDKVRILGMVGEGPGFDSLNNQVNELLRQWVNTAIVDALDKYFETSEDDWEYGRLCFNVGIVQQKNGNYDEALELYYKAHEIYVKNAGPEATDTAACIYQIGQAKKKKGDYEGALVELKKATKIDEVAIGYDDPELAKDFCGIADVLDKMERYDEALAEYGKAIEIEERVLGRKSQNAATTIGAIGTVLYKKGESVAALEKLYESHEILIEIFGKYHPNVATSGHNIGVILAETQDVEAALVELRSALAIREKVLGKNHPYTEMTRDAIESYVAQS